MTTSFPRIYALLACLMSVAGFIIDLWEIAVGGRVPDSLWMNLFAVAMVSFVLFCVITIIVFIKRGLPLFSPLIYLVYFFLEIFISVGLAAVGIIDMDSAGGMKVPPAMCAIDMVFCVFYLVINVRFFQDERTG